MSTMTKVLAVLGLGLATLAPSAAMAFDGHGGEGFVADRVAYRRDCRRGERFERRVERREGRRAERFERRDRR